MSVQSSLLPFEGPGQGSVSVSVLITEGEAGPWAGNAHQGAWPGAVLRSAPFSLLPSKEELLLA